MNKLPLFILVALLCWATPAQADPASDKYNDGLTFKRQGKIDKAIASMNEALKLRPDYAAAHHSLGMLYRRKNALQRGELHLREAVNLEPKWANAHYSLGLNLFLQKRRDEAIVAMRLAMKYDPKDATTLEQLGVMLGRKNPKEAMAVLEKATKLKPDDPVILHKLGIACRRAGKLKKAEKILLLAASKKMTAGLAFDLGVMFRHKHEHRKALVYYSKAVKLDPKFSDAWWDMAVISDRLKEADQARKAYAAFVKLKSKGRAADIARDRLKQLKAAGK